MKTKEDLIDINILEQVSLSTSLSGKFKEEAEVTCNLKNYFIQNHVALKFKKVKKIALSAHERYL